MNNRNIEKGEKIYMNTITGAVDKYEDWYYENEEGEQVNAVDLNEVVEVFLTSKGEYIA